MAKKREYGFKSPIRRSTNNITGNKVGGDLSGGECKIVSLRKLELLASTIYKFELDSNRAIGLFNKDIIVAAIGGYFCPSEDTKITLAMEIKGVRTSDETMLFRNVLGKVGLEINFDAEEIEPSTPVIFSLEIETVGVTLEYTNFSFGFVDYAIFVENENAYEHFFNSKRVICYPEQFYFFNEVVLENSESGGPIILKSCNRCQRFLPINHWNERVQLAFANHCTTKAPCKHANFSKYEILEDEITKEQWKVLKKGNFKFHDGYVISYYGHQLECKACKKFFVNAALNHLRTSTQHREDALRRRAFELLIRKLLKLDWIYHTFRTKTGNEFDEYIWNKFEKKCFKCGVFIPSAAKMDLDHTMPLVHLYPLDETATCLCATCNGAKSDLFPIDFYSGDELRKLSKLTGIPYKILMSRQPNTKVIRLLQENIIWFFEEFIIFDEYVKVRDGKRAADSIIHSLQKVINSSDNSFDLNEEYQKQTNA